MYVCKVFLRKFYNLVAGIKRNVIPNKRSKQDANDFTASCLLGDTFSLLNFSGSILLFICNVMDTAKVEKLGSLMCFCGKKCVLCLHLSTHDLKSFKCGLVELQKGKRFETI